MLYEKLGLPKSTYYYFYNKPQLSLRINSNNLRSIQETDYEQIFNLDKEISGENRKSMIQNLSTKGWPYFDKDENDLLGYFLPNVGEGVICAKDETAGIELLKIKHCQKNGRAVLPVENKSGRKFLEEHGFKLVNKAPRMVLGEEIHWKPDLIFSRIGGFYG